jgi:pimeloyl-ACP methyl ester carboxylesterase/DNA-binding CsgD family transcriptional regulator
LINAAFEPLESHFENAQSLIETQGRVSDSAKYSMKMIDADSRPSALIGKDGRIAYANSAAIEIFGLTKDKRPDDTRFESGHFKTLMANLQSLDEFEFNKVISIFGMESLNGEQMLKVALTKVNDSNGDAIGHISAIHISWFPDIGKQFQAQLNLTPVELEITKAIVTGQSLSELAAERGRSIGTVRHQSKMLLAKLNLRSQTELACLYSGFSKFNTKRSGLAKDDGVTVDRRIESHVLPRSDNRGLDYDMVGPSSGSPVLFFPGLLGGTTVTDEMHQALTRHKLRLIMVWRPGLADSGLNGPADRDSFARYADDIKDLLDELGIANCPIIAHITGTMFGYAVAKHLSGKITGLINVNGIVPMQPGPHLAKVDKTERLRLYLMRHFPKIGRFVVHGALGRVDSGYDHEFLQAFLGSNEFDQQTIKRDDIRVLFRQAFQKTTKQGYDSFTNELLLASSDWQYLIDDRLCPVRNFIGQFNVHYTPSVVQAFAADKTDFSVDVIPNTAHLLLYQKPEVIFKAVAELVPHPRS